jgi:hypothetical protein
MNQAIIADGLEPKSSQHACSQRLDLDLSEAHSDAGSRAATKRHQAVRSSSILVAWHFESGRIELIGIPEDRR